MSSLKAVQKLQKAGIEKEMAEAIVEVLADCIQQCINGTLATKAEVAALDKKIAVLEEKMEGRMTALEERMDKKMEKLAARMSKEIRIWAGVQFIALSIIIGVFG